MSQVAHWDRQYVAEEVPWDRSEPATELRRVVEATSASPPGRLLELGCGTGADAVWLAGRGFRVTAVDLSHEAVRRARRRAAEAGASVDFRSGDLRDWPMLGGPFDRVYDAGCYGAIRRADPAGYLRTMEHVTRPGATALILVGNDWEPETGSGPPTASAAALLSEFWRLFDVIHLREFRFDVAADGIAYLGWSCLLRRR